MKKFQKMILLALGTLLVSVTATATPVAFSDSEILEQFVADRGVTGVKVLRVKEISDERSDEVSEMFDREMWVSYFDLVITIDGEEHKMLNEKVLIPKRSNYRRSQLIDLAKGIERFAALIGRSGQYAVEPVDPSGSRSLWRSS